MTKLTIHLRSILSTIIITAFVLILAAYPAMAGALSTLFAGTEDTSGTDDERKTAPAAAFNPDDYEFTISNDTATIVGYLGDDDELEIPSEIDGHPVTALGTASFSYCKFKSLTIPDSVELINSKAFEYCTVSDSLILPAYVSIGNDAFAYADLPETLIIPEGTVIGIESFAYCEGLRTLYVQSDAVIGNRAFNYSEDLVTLACENNVTIEGRAFEYCDELENVILSQEVQVIDKPFAYCDKAQIVYVDEDEIPEHLADIGESVISAGSFVASWRQKGQKRKA